MKVLNFLILLFISCLFINYSKSQDQSPITLIVNPNINNTYIVGEKCGIDTFTCNSISDAIAYFNSIAVLVDNGTIYQQLNIKLSNGTYGIKESQVNLFLFNCTISPLDDGVSNVIFNGYQNPLNSTQSMFSVHGSGQGTTSVLISGITFIYFNHSISNIVSINTYINVTFDKCNFDGYQVQSNTNMISFTRINAPANATIPTSCLIISNSNIFNIGGGGGGNNTSSFSNSDLITVTGLNVTLYNVYINSVNSLPQSVLKVDSSYTNIVNCIFSNFNTSLGAVYGFRSNVTFYNSTFDRLSAMSGPGLFNHIANDNYNSTFTMAYCLVSNCYSPTSSAVFLLNNPYSLALPNNYILYSSFNYNNGSNGGVLYTTTVPVTFENCIFDSNNAETGSIAQVIRTSLSVSYSTILNSNSSNFHSIAAGGTFVSWYSQATFIYNTFSKQLVSFQCVNSTVIIENSNNLNPYYNCLSCKQLFVNSNSICKDSSTTSTLNFDSSDSSDSFKLIPKFSILILILLITIITISFNFYL
ncbi:hypothetical protein ACTFIZ_000475 [Dictyostelium cf. discoideum]